MGRDAWNVFQQTLLLLLAFGLTTPAAAVVTERNVYYTYDVVGRQLTAKFDSVSGADGITNTYNAFGDLASSTISMAGFSKTLTSAYDGAGRRTQLTHPDGTYFTTSYDALGRADVAWWTTAGGTTQFMDINYDAFGRRSTINRASSWTDYGYDDLSRLTALTQRFAGNVGNLAQSFSYNPASQITSETRDNDAFAYTGMVTVNRAYAVNGLNQYTSAGPATFTYDANGNLTSDGTNNYTYDVENRLVKAVTGSTATNLTYDPLGRLFQVDQGSSATTTRFVYDGDNLAAEYDGSNAMTKRYYFGPGEDEPILEDTGGALNCSGTRFLHTNQQGSIIALADCWGNRTNINSYDEYGIPGSSNSGRFQYTGQAWLPEIGMYYYKARIYSPTLGRFLQTDPVGHKDQINLYAYVADDPVNESDPSGQYLWPWERPVTVVGGTQTERLHYQRVVADILATPRGRELLNQIVGPWYSHGSPQTVKLSSGIGSSTGAIFSGNRPTGVIQVDPDFHPQVQTRSGIVIASDERIVAHELGHSVTGTGDVGKGQMDNIHQNENPIVGALGLSARTQYARPSKDPNAKMETPHTDIGFCRGTRIGNTYTGSIC